MVESDKRGIARDLRARGLTYAEIGEALGMTHQGARYFVLAPPPQKRGRKPKPQTKAAHKPARREWTKAEIALLGTDTDYAIAARIGIGHATVQRKRTELGIPFYVGPRVRA